MKIATKAPRHEEKGGFVVLSGDCFAFGFGVYFSILLIR